MTKAKPVQPDRSAENRIAKRAAEKATDSMREKILVALLGFVLTGVIGTALTTWIQQRGWSWQNRVAKIDKDTENAIVTYKSASELINARWHATYRMVRALERGSEGEEWKAAKDGFDAADRDWSLRYTNVAREIEFYIDTPFGVEGSATLGKVWLLGCADFALDSTAQNAISTQSGRVVLEVLNHCHGRMKDELEVLIDKRTIAPSAERKALTDLSYRRLDHLYKTNEALRCVIFGRALTIRQSIESQSYWETFFGIGQLTYKLGQKNNTCA
jgi:hypothetical protein